MSVAVSAVELGGPGHFVAANSCRWKRHTQIGSYRVSTIGDYFPERRGRRETLGAGADGFFETMVFRTSDTPDGDNDGCGCRTVENWSGLEQERYATAGEAQAGHERYVAKYLAIVNP